MISHLIIRNDHFRKLGSSVLESAFGALQNFSPTREYIKQTMGIDLTNPSGLFIQRIMETIRKKSPTANEEQLNSLKKSFLSNMSPEYLDQFIDFIIEGFKFSSQAITRLAEPLIRTAITDSLKMNLESEQFIVHLQLFDWVLFENNQKFILPDCIAISKSDTSYHSLIGSSADEMDTIYFPISKDKMLVGFKGKKPEIPETINLLFAENSWDFFIAPNESCENAMLAKAIRKKPLAEIKSVVENVETKILQGTLFQ